MNSALATARLTIDLAALKQNWRKLAALVNASGAGAREAGAVVKADAYGLGIDPCAERLWQAGARTFFTAYAHEGVALRKLLPQARIFVLAGLDAQAANACHEARLTPVINSRAELETWRTEGKKAGAPLPCALHFDTGMNRLGFDRGEAQRIAGDREGVEVVLVMSHLACSEERANPMNARQLGEFRQVASHFPGVRLSFANSGGMFLGQDHHFDITRPGIALYGGEPVSGETNPMAPVVKFEARIVQVREAKKGETIGYSATQTLTRDSKVAVAGAGYADGIRRGASGGTGGGAQGWLAGHRVPVLGRVSMDLTAFDVTDVPQQLLETTQWIELFGPNIALDEFARAAGTISYEVLTGLGKRAERSYVG
ncbi:MAG TPA: alanine racemase [Rhizobiaceae bacterium]|nr:alanine racemase [Rhizobiaceae bacterium]